MAIMPPSKVFIEEEEYKGEEDAQLHGDSQPMIRRDYGLGASSKAMNKDMEI